jgi:hypothetical protein
MSEPNAFVSPEYPVLFTVVEGGQASVPEGFGGVSLALLVNGIPSFLATVPVDEELLGGVVTSLGKGDVRVAVVGISVNGRDLPGMEGESKEPWKGETTTSGTFPAAFLSLVCADGRRIGVARIVARRESAQPEEVARYVMKQITRGVQVPDLASAG